MGFSKRREEGYLNRCIQILLVDFIWIRYENLTVLLSQSCRGGTSFQFVGSAPSKAFDGFTGRSLLAMITGVPTRYDLNKGIVLCNTIAKLSFSQFHCFWLSIHAQLYCLHAPLHDKNEYTSQS